MRTLNYRQRKFVCNYLGPCNGNGVEAAKKAGYLNPAADSERLLNHPIVRAAINAKLEEAAMDADEVLARISDQASVDIAEFLDEYDHQAGVDPDTGEPIYESRLRFNFKKAKARGKTHLVKKLKVLPDGSIEFELHDSAAALDRLAKVHGLYKERFDLNVAIGDTEEDRQRFIAVFGGFAQLTGSGGAGADGGQAIPGTLCDSGEQGCLDSGTTLALPEPVLAEGGDGEEPEDPGLHASAIGQE